MQKTDSFVRLQELARTFSRSNSDDSFRPPHVLIGATGSVACVKIPLIVKRIFEVENNYVEVKIVATDPALHFFSKNDFDSQVEVYVNEDEWTWQKITDPVLHIELRNWADILIIVPLDANSLAKIAGGLCDNLLTCVVRAWNFSEKVQKPIIGCPAMNTQMWLHPFTKKHIDILKNELNFMIIEPVKKKLACGDYGIGALADINTIVDRLHVFLVEWDKAKNSTEDLEKIKPTTSVHALNTAVERLKLKSKISSQLSNSYLSSYGESSND